MYIYIIYVRYYIYLRMGSAWVSCFFPPRHILKNDVPRDLLRFALACIIVVHVVLFRFEKSFAHFFLYFFLICKSE